jgi:hypothetical protein
MPTWGHQSLEYQNSKLKFSDFDAGGATSELWCAWPTVCSWGPENFGKDAPTRYQWGQKVRSHWRFWPQKGYSLGFADLILSFNVNLNLNLNLNLSIYRSIYPWVTLVCWAWFCAFDSARLHLKMDWRHRLSPTPQVAMSIMWCYDTIL